MRLARLYAVSLAANPESRPVEASSRRRSLLRRSKKAADEQTLAEERRAVPVAPAAEIAGAADRV